MRQPDDLQTPNEYRIAQLEAKLAAAEAEKLNLAGHIENFRKHNVELAGELTLERQISAMLRKTLVKLKKEYNSQGKVFPATLSIALVREKVMRKSQLLNTKEFSSKLVGEENE